MSQHPTLNSYRRACLILARSFGGDIDETALDHAQRAFDGTLSVAVEIGRDCIFRGHGPDHRAALASLFASLRHAVRGAHAYALSHAARAAEFMRAIERAEDRIAFLPASPLFATCARCHREWQRHEWPSGVHAVPLAITCPCGAAVSPIEVAT